MAGIGGKTGRLALVLIHKISIYYGLAIRRNCESIASMKKAIMETLYHLGSTDKKPNTNRVRQEKILGAGGSETKLQTS